jgi:hypothetical protein
MRIVRKEKDREGDKGMVSRVRGEGGKEEVRSEWW